MHADIELILTTSITDSLGVRCVTERPADLDAALPLVHVERFGGADATVLDVARVDIDAYVGPDTDGNADRAAAYALAEQVRTHLRWHLTGQVIGGAVIALVETLTGPRHQPYDESPVRRCGATYQITAHSLL